MKKLIFMITITTAILFSSPCVSHAMQIAALCYHAVSNSPFELSTYRISDTEMESDLQYFTDNEYTFFKPCEMWLAKSTKNIVLTFDDGYEDFYNIVFPLLQKYNAKAAVYIIGSRIDKTGYLKSWQIKEMDDSGLVEIGNHTNIIHYYPYTSSIYANNPTLVNDFIEDVKDCSSKIYAITGHGTESLAYPSGQYTTKMDRILKVNLGYTTTFTTDYGIIDEVEEVAAPMKRVYRIHGESTNDLVKKIDRCR